MRVDGKDGLHLGAGCAERLVQVQAQRQILAEGAITPVIRDVRPFRRVAC